MLNHVIIFLIYQLALLGSLFILSFIFDSIGQKIIIFIVFFIIENLVAFILYWTDKRKAEQEEFRIPELTLHMLCGAFGFVGSIGAMKACHHKTSKHEFYMITYCLGAVNVVLYLFVGVIVFYWMP